MTPRRSAAGSALAHALVALPPAIPGRHVHHPHPTPGITRSRSAPLDGDTASNRDFRESPVPPDEMEEVYENQRRYPVKGVSAVCPGAWAVSCVLWCFTVVWWIRAKVNDSQIFLMSVF